MDGITFTYINPHSNHLFFVFCKESPYRKESSFLSFISVKELKDALKKEKFFGLVDQKIKGYSLLQIQENIFSIFSQNQFICEDFFTFFMVETSLFDEEGSVLDFLDYYFSTKKLIKDTKVESITLNDVRNTSLDSEKLEALSHCIHKILSYPIPIPFKIEDTYFEGDFTIYEFVKRKKAQQKQKEKSLVDQITLKELLHFLEKTKGYYTLEDTLFGVPLSDIDLYIRLSLPDTINTYKNLYTFLLVVSTSFDMYQTIESFCEQYKKELALEKISQAEIITGKKALLWMGNKDKVQILDWILQYVHFSFLSIPLSFSSLSEFLKDFDEDQKELPISYLVQLKKIDLGKKYETIPLYEMKNAFDQNDHQVQGISFEQLNQYMQVRLKKYEISLSFQEVMQKEIYYISSDLSLSAFLDYYIETWKFEKRINADNLFLKEVVSIFKEDPTSEVIHQVDAYFSYRLKQSGIGSYSTFSTFLNGVKKDGELSIKHFIENYIDHLFSRELDFAYKKSLQPMITETMKTHEQYFPNPTILYEDNPINHVYKMVLPKEI